MARRRCPDAGEHLVADQAQEGLGRVGAAEVEVGGQVNRAPVYPPLPEVG